jgi:hypothetical protein
MHNGRCHAGRGRQPESRYPESRFERERKRLLGPGYSAHAEFRDDTHGAVISLLTGVLRRSSPGSETAPPELPSQIGAGGRSPVVFTAGRQTSGAPCMGPGCRQSRAFAAYNVFWVSRRRTLCSFLLQKPRANSCREVDGVCAALPCRPGTCALPRLAVTAILGHGRPSGR